MTPDYSPTLLKAFLRARVIVGVDEHGSEVKSWKVLREKLRAESGLMEREIDAAYAGHLFVGTKRARLWAALGVYPGDFSVLLDDEGGQDPPSGSSRGDAALPPKAADGHSPLSNGMTQSAADALADAKAGL